MANFVVTTLSNESAFTTNLTTETNDGSGLSLREALTISNSTGGPDTISFDASLAGGQINLSGVELIIISNVEINGDIDGDGQADITISGNSQEQRMFRVAAGETTFNGLNLKDGDFTGAGIAGAGVAAYVSAVATAIFSNTNITNMDSKYGAIFNYGTVEILNSTISGTDTLSGGAVYNRGTLTVANSTFSENTTLLGGAIANLGTATATISNTTIWGNRATVGGGVFNGDGSTITLTNNTITGNWAETEEGGGVYNKGVATITNNIVAGNLAGGGSSDMFTAAVGTTSYLGVNLFSQAGAGDAQDLFLSTLGNIFASTQLIDPDNVPNGNEFTAGVLADNGGNVQTVAISNTSAAYNTGSDANLPTDTLDSDGNGNSLETTPFDGRGEGFGRIDFGQSDIGAFELAPAFPEFAGDLSDGSQWVLILESAANGTVVFDADATDGQGGALDTNVAFAIVSGNADHDGDGNETFAINASNGEVTVNDADDLTLTNGIQSFDLTIEVDNAQPTNNTATSVLKVIVAPTPADFLVDTLSDVDDGDFSTGNFSLREALRLANDNASTLESISFDTSLVGGTIKLENGELVIAGNVSVSGDIDGSGSSDIIISGGNTSRVFNLTSGVVTLDGLEISDGQYTPSSNPTTSTGGSGINIAAGVDLFLKNSSVHDNSGSESSTPGAGIFNRGNLHIQNSIVSQNESLDTSGGGLENLGTALIENSSFIDNSSVFAGAINNRISGMITLVNTTLSDNSAEYTGGLRNRGIAEIVNSTIARNVGNGLGNLSAATMNISNSTITGNLAETGGGGIYNSGPLTLTNSIVTGNFSTVSGLGTLPDDIKGTLTYAGVNILGQNGSGRAGIDIIEDNLSNIFASTTYNAQLLSDIGVLDDNGGQVQTIAITAAGVAANAGLNGVIPADITDIDNDGDVTENIPFDARGELRLTGGTVDIGAVELIEAQTINGTNGDDILVSRSASDTIKGLNGNDNIDAGDGNDIINGGGGDDTIDGGHGIDTVTYHDATASVDAYLLFTGIDTGGSGTDTLTSIENLTGSNFNDRLIGDANDNVLKGGNGDDIIKGKGGNDSFYGDDGNDRITGSTGDDTIYGGAGDDVLSANAGLDSLFGGSGNDHLLGGRDDDILNGNTGDDVLRGNLGVDILNGGNGSDILHGGGQNDILNGGINNDFLFGDNGNDILNGGTGNDAMTGGALKDTFVFENNNSGFDRIKDFETGIDKIDLTDFAFTSFADVQAIATEANNGVRINTGNGNVLFVENFLLADFDAGDVLL